MSQMQQLFPSMFQINPAAFPQQPPLGAPPVQQQPTPPPPVVPPRAEQPLSQSSLNNNSQTMVNGAPSQPSQVKSGKDAPDPWAGSNNARSSVNPGTNWNPDGTYNANGPFYLPPPVGADGLPQALPLPGQPGQNNQEMMVK